MSSRFSKWFRSPKGEDNKHAYHSPIEHKVQQALSPFQGHIKNQAAASLLLLTCTLTAVIWATLPTASHYYFKWINTSIGFHIAHLSVQQPLRFWVNDVLLTLFFFFVGLEIKREFLVGELTHHKRTTFIVIAALGGMIVPTFFYLLLNIHTPTQVGWGIPMATDTAFALGILTTFNKKIPSGIFTFMAALAIIDDIGAILVIAIFYTHHLNTLLLFIALLLAGILLLLNYAGFRKALPYLVLGVIIWALIESAGVHGTLAGILVAFLIPARPQKGPKQFLKKMRTLLNRFEERKQKKPLILKDPKQHAVLEKAQAIVEQATTPLQRWESNLEGFIIFLVLPVFALVNAGISVRLDLIHNALTHPASLGIILGLVLGKPLGIALFSRVAIWFNWGSLPQDTRFAHILSVSFLGGVGFTMSLFIANLAFSSTQPHTLMLAKAGILIGSLLAATLGIVSLWLTSRFYEN